MTARIILASGSEIRKNLLLQAGVLHDIKPARIDEDAIRNSLVAEGVSCRDIAAELAEAKARKVSQKHPDSLVIGCDQILDLNGQILSKPADRSDAIAQLNKMRGTGHTLFSAAVIFQRGEPQWRFIGKVKMEMRTLSDEYLNGYVERNWHSIQYSVGCYKIEEEGPRLFSKVTGDYFSVLGMPLLEILGYLTQRGELQA